MWVILSECKKKFRNWLLSSLRFFEQISHVRAFGKTGKNPKFEHSTLDSIQLTVVLNF